MNLNFLENVNTLRNQRYSSFEDSLFDSLSSEKQKVLEGFLKSILPDHGSFTSDWTFEFCGNEVLIHNSYECLDSEGKKVGSLPFELVLFSDFSFEINFSEPESDYATIIGVVLSMELASVFTETRTYTWSLLIEGVGDTWQD